ncbi:MAG: hypothetical protein PHW34_00875 [Hespellia sp.]|nr:hypothetical protein [Hespellia sp.]
MHFNYFRFNTEQPAIRINLADSQYQIQKALDELGLKLVEGTLHISRTTFQFYSEEKFTENMVLQLNKALLKQNSIKQLCHSFGAKKIRQNDEEAPPFVKDEGFTAYAIIHEIDVVGPGFVLAEMEFVAKNDVDILFSDTDYQFFDELEAGPLRNAIAAYRSFGIQSREFQLAKLDYLITLPCTAGNCYFPDNSYHFYQLGKFYLADVCIDNPDFFSRKMDTGYEVFRDIPENGVILLTHNIILSGSALLHMESVTLPLEQLFSLVPLDRSQSKNSISAPLKAFSPTSVFDEADVCNVGQALLVLLKNAGNVEGFFDFGLPNALNRRYFPQSNVIAAAIQGLFTTQAAPPTTIILSHWHTDHINLALQVTGSWSLDWYVPGGFSTPTITKINGLIRTHGGALHLLLPGAAMPNFGVHLNIHKISTPGSSHPHANGIFAEMTLPTGNTIMLAGDCIYSAVFAAKNLPTYTYLQATHHGGCYSQTATTQNPAHIPAPNPAPAVSQVIYSYSTPNTHHHPSNVADHTHQGWGNTLHTPAAPALPAPPNVNGYALQ